MKKLLPALLLLLFTGCKKEKSTNPVPTTMTGTAGQATAQVTISGISPSIVTSKMIATLTGTGFGTSISGVTVSFAGISAVVQSVTNTKIEVYVPVTTGGTVTLIVGGQTISGPTFTYADPLLASYVGGDITLTTQAQVDTFVSLNKGKQLQITGNLTVGTGIYTNTTSDITSVSGLSMITAVSGSLYISNCPQLTDISFLNSLTAAGSLYFYNFGATTITVDHLTITGSITLDTLVSLNKVSFKALTTVSGSVSIYSVQQLTYVNVNALNSISGRLTLTSTGLTDVSGFSVLNTVGSLMISRNSALMNLHGLEHLTILSAPAIGSGGVLLTSLNNVIGISITGNTKLTSLTGLQNVITVPLVYISNNPGLNDFCPFKTQINTLSALPAYSYSIKSILLDDNPNFSNLKLTTTPALTLTINGGYATTQDALTAVALCK